MNYKALIAVLFASIVVSFQSFAKDSQTTTTAKSEKSPTVIKFNKGKSSKDIKLNLAAGASKNYSVNAMKDQHMVVEPKGNKVSPDNLSITMTHGSVIEGDESQFISVTLAENGEYQFAVKNVSKKALKFTLHVQIDKGP